MKIQVTQDDIDNGVPVKPQSCPIALAIKRVVKEGTGVFVCDKKIRLRGNPAYCFDYTGLGRQIRDFIGRFDCLEPVRPFEFGLDIPQELLP